MAEATRSGLGKRPAWLRDNHLFQAWLVLMLAIVFGTCLAAVHVNLSERIAQNKLNESLEQIPGLIWNEGESGTSVEINPKNYRQKKEQHPLLPCFSGNG